MGVAVGGVIAAALVSMGTASADDLFTPTASADDLLAPAASADDLLAPAASADLDPFEQLVQTWDPFAFTSTGAPNDIIGIIASQINSDLAPTVFGPELNTIASQILAGDFSAPATTDEDGFEDLVRAFVDPNAFTSVCNTSDICTPADPNIWFEQLAYDLDSHFAPTVFGPELDTIADQIISAFTATVF